MVTRALVALVQLLQLIKQQPEFQGLDLNSPSAQLRLPPGLMTAWGDDTGVRVGDQVSILPGHLVTQVEPTITRAHWLKSRSIISRNSIGLPADRILLVSVSRCARHIPSTSPISYRSPQVRLRRISSSCLLWLPSLSMSTVHIPSDPKVGEWRAAARTGCLLGGTCAYRRLVPHPYDHFSWPPMVWWYPRPRSSPCGQVPAWWLATGSVQVDDGPGMAGGDARSGRAGTMRCVRCVGVSCGPSSTGTSARTTYPNRDKPHVRCWPSGPCSILASNSCSGHDLKTTDP